jgi:hypothetical protein
MADVSDDETPPAPDAPRCTVCRDVAMTTCPRCDGPLCKMHRAMSVDRICLRCEAAWQRGALTRTLVLTPLAITVCAGVAAAFIGIQELLHRLSGARFEYGGVGWIVVFFGFPIAVAVVAVRAVERRTFRRRFLAQRPSPIPAARVVDRR